MNQQRFIRYTKFGLFVVAMGFIGAFSSIVIRRFEGGITTIFSSLLTYSRENAPWVVAAVILISSCGFLFFYHRSKKFLVLSGTEEDDRLLNNSAAAAQGFASIGVILIITLLGLLATEDTPHLLTMVGLCLIGTLLCISMEACAVNLQKQITPGKKGDPLNFRFEKDWMESCDEAEKYAAYVSAFWSFMLLKKVLAVLMAVSIIGQITFDTGVTAILVTGILWLAHSLSYIFYGVKLSHGDLPR